MNHSSLSSDTSYHHLQKISPQYSAQPIPQRTHSIYYPLAPATPWRTGFWKRFPWTAFLAILGAVLMGIIMIVVLVVFDEKEVSRWKVSPAVYLAIASAIAYVLLVFALNRGVEIAKAFNAPILGSSDSNMPVDDLLKEAGQREVRYSAVKLAPSGTVGGDLNVGIPEKLVMHEPGSITAPQEGKLFVG
jgi:hypothetical protein